MSSDCLIRSVGPIWVQLYNVIFVSKEELAQENRLIRMNAVEQDLENCLHQLTSKEAELQQAISLTTSAALKKKSAGDLSGAKKKLQERKKHQLQLTRVQNNIAVVETHMDALQGIELNKSVINTLKASGHALKNLNIKGGVDEADRVVMDVDDQLREANEVWIVYNLLFFILQCGFYLPISYHLFCSDFQSPRRLQRICIRIQRLRRRTCERIGRALRRR